MSLSSKKSISKKKKGSSFRSKPNSALKNGEYGNLIEKNLNDNYHFYARDGVTKPISRAVKLLIEKGDFTPQAIFIMVEKIEREEVGKLIKKYSDQNKYISEEMSGMFEQGLFSTRLKSSYVNSPTAYYSMSFAKPSSSRTVQQKVSPSPSNPAPQASSVLGNNTSDLSSSGKSGSSSLGQATPTSSPSVINQPSSDQTVQSNSTPTYQPPQPPQPDSIPSSQPSPAQLSRITDPDSVPTLKPSLSPVVQPVSAAPAQTSSFLSGQNSSVPFPKGSLVQSHSESLTEGQKKKLVEEIQKRVNKGLEKGKLDLENKKDINLGLPEQGTNDNMGKNALLTSALAQKAMQKVEATQKPYDYSRNPNINVDARRQEEISQYRQEAREEAEKEMDKFSKDLPMKQRLALKVAGKYMDRIAFAVAEKMAEQANRGGLRAVMPIFITYFLSFLKDGVDVILNLVDLTGIGAALAVPVAWLLGASVAVLVMIFWALADGGTAGFVRKSIVKKVVKKYGLKYTIASVIDGIPAISVIPIFLIFNVWSHYDYCKSIKKSKKEYAEMTDDWNHGRRISNKNLAEYGPATY